MNRRDFFAVLGGGVVVMLVEDDLYAQETGGGRGGPRPQQPQNLNAWLHIGEAGVVTVYSGKVEVGQNARTYRLSRYRVPRFADMPRIESVLLDRKDLPSAGAGETPIMGLAPAIGNAIFDATGQRIRSLPMVPNKLPAADSSPPAY